MDDGFECKVRGSSIQCRSGMQWNCRVNKADEQYDQNISSDIYTHDHHRKRESPAEALETYRALVMGVRHAVYEIVNLVRNSGESFLD
jgi:hypothetical protein